MINNRDIEALRRFGDNLRKIRLDKNLSQQQLALEADLSKNQIGNIERGEVNITLSSIMAIAKTLKIPAKDLFDF